MAQYQHLPIYKATYDLLREVTQATANFPKAFKYSLGDKLRAEVVEMVVFVFKANSARGTDRVQQATLFLERLQVVELLVSHANTYQVQGRLAAALCSAGHCHAVPNRINNSTFAIL